VRLRDGQDQNVLLDLGGQMVVFRFCHGSSRKGREGSPPDIAESITACMELPREESSAPAPRNAS
jgi:hypothetical protein